MKVAARERGALSGPGSLPERERIVEVARDAEVSEICKRLCVLPEGLARRHRGLSLRGRLFITGRGMSRHGSPGDQSVRVLLTCRNVETDWIWRGMQEVCRMLDCAARRMKRGHKNKDPETELERRHCPVAANKFAAGEGGRSVMDWTLSY